MNRTRGSLVVLAALNLLLTGCGDDSPLAPDARLSAPVQPPDTAPPATPTGVYGLIQSRRVKLGWEPNLSDPDCAGFVLSRTGGGATVQLIADPLDVTVYVDTHPFAGLAVYEVRAVDADGNASAAATFTVDFHADGIERSGDY